VTARVNKKNEQHVVPRTYLKHWRIAEDKNFVYGIDFSNKYKKSVQTFGLNDKVFKERKYYNDPSFENPYIIEDVFGEEIEPTYDQIMAEIASEKKLSIDIRKKIMQWLYISQMRSPYIRNNTERIAKFLYKTTEYYNNSDLLPEMESFFEQQAKEIAKETQLSAFAHEGQLQSLLTLFIQTLNAKHWRVLKSIPQVEFWTNDNPGFSPNIVERFAKDFPYHAIMEMNARSVIFYPLSPKYCLEVSPFFTETPLDVCALTMEIKYEQAPIELIDFINNGIFYTCNKVLVSNNKELLEYCIKRQ
jgi:hypothetical protein